MNYKILFVFILFSITKFCTAQKEQDVINFLENNYFPKKVQVDYSVDLAEIALPRSTKQKLEKAIKFGITNTHFFAGANKSSTNVTNTSQVSLSKLMKPEAMYLFKCNLIDYKVYADSKLIFSADLIAIDLMTGEYLFFKNISLSKTLHDANKSSGDLIAKTVRETLTDLIKRTFGTHNKIVELVEVDKDKVKKVGVLDLAFRKNNSRKDAAAYIVEKELEVDGKPFFVFQKIAELKNPGKKKVGNKRVYEVGDGKKELLLHFNAQTPIYVSHYYLGAKK